MPGRRGCVSNMPMRKISIDVSSVRTKQELHEVLASELSFPSFYGKNWDAFWDTITGLVEMPQVLEIRGLDALARALPKDAAQLITCLNDLGKDYPEINFEIRYI